MNKTKLLSIKIKGYKSISFEDPLNLNMGDVNILLGANGVGKSNIIGFFRMLNFMMSGSLQSYVATNGFNNSLLHYGAKHTPSLEGALVFSNGDIKDYYSFTLTAAAGQKLIITNEELKYITLSKGLNPRFRQIESNYQESGLTTASDATSRIVRKFLTKCKAYQFHDSSQNGALRQASRIDAAQYLLSEGNNLAAFLYFLKNNYIESYLRIIRYVKMIMPNFGDFYLEPSNNFVGLNWKDASGNDYVFTSDQFSDGTIRFIALATLLLQPEETMPCVIIIDEPELGLHPYAIDQLSEMIKDASIHAQIIISTQSPKLIDAFNANNITIIEQDESTHATVARQLSDEQLKVWLEDYSLSELWYKNIIGGMP